MGQPERQAMYESVPVKSQLDGLCSECSHTNHNSTFIIHRCFVRRSRNSSALLGFMCHASHRTCIVIPHRRDWNPDRQQLLTYVVCSVGAVSIYVSRHCSKCRRCNKK